jgi:hypothetical protein
MVYIDQFCPPHLSQSLRSGTVLTQLAQTHFTAYIFANSSHNQLTTANLLSPLSKGLACNCTNQTDDRSIRWNGKYQYIRKREYKQ